MHALAGFNFNWISDTPENDELAKIILYYFYRQDRKYEKQKKKNF